MTDAIIEITGLKKTFRSGDVDVHALRGVDLTVKRGEFLAVIGPSGSGKSTLFHILGGLTPSTDGRIVIDGKDMSHLSDSERTALRRHVVGFVFQKYNLLPTLTVGGNIEIARDIAHRTGPFEEQFLEVLRLLGLDKKLDRKRRRATARRHRPRHRQSPRNPPRRRAHRQPRYGKFECRARCPSRPEQEDRPDDPHDHPQSRSRRLRRPYRENARRASGVTAREPAAIPSPTANASKFVSTDPPSRLWI